MNDERECGWVLYIAQQVRILTQNMRLSVGTRGLWRRFLDFEQMSEYYAGERTVEERQYSQSVELPELLAARWS